MKQYKILFPTLLLVLVYLTSCRHHPTDPDDHFHKRDTLVIMDSINLSDTAVISGRVEFYDYKGQLLGSGANLEVNLTHNLNSYKTVTDSTGKWKIEHVHPATFYKVTINKEGFIPAIINSIIIRSDKPYDAGVQQLHEIVPLVTILNSYPTITKSPELFPRDSTVTGTDGLPHTIRINDTVNIVTMDFDFTVLSPNGSLAVSKSYVTGVYFLTSPNNSLDDTSATRYRNNANLIPNDNDFSKISIRMVVDNDNSFKGFYPNSGDTIYAVCAAAYRENEFSGSYAFSPKHTSPIQIILP